MPAPSFLTDFDRLRFFTHLYAGWLWEMVTLATLSVIACAVCLAVLRVARPPRESGGTRRWRQFAPGVILLAAFLLQIFWMKTHDLWSTDLDQGGPSSGIYLIFRLIHLCCIGSLLIMTGQLAFRALAARVAVPTLSALDGLILSFFAGAALWRVAIFGLGYLHAYYLAVAIAATVPVLLAGSSSFFRSAAGLIGEARSMVQNMGRRSLGITLLLSSALLFVSFLIFLFNGLYVNDLDGDYVTHYGPYYDMVLQSHSLWPNDVWYQYFYSKGAGIAFLSMLLSDKQSKQLTAMIFFAFSCLVTFRFVQRASGERLWGILAVIACASLFVVDDSGAFEKHHAVTGAMLLSISYCYLLAWDAEGPHRLFWAVAGGMCTLPLVLLSPPAFPYAALLVGSGMIVSLARRQWSLAGIAGTWLSVGLITLLGVLLINQATTGLPEVTPFRFFLHFLNPARFANWVSPYLLTYLEQGSSGHLGEIGTPDAGISALLHQLLAVTRLDKVARIFFFRMLILLGVLFLLSLRGRTGMSLSSEFKRTVWICCTALLSVVLGYLLVRQPVSVYRASAFSTFYICILLAVVAWAFARYCFSASLAPFIAAGFTALVLIQAVVAATFVSPQRTEARFGYLLGRLTLAAAFEREFGVPKALYKVREAIGLDRRILFLQASNQAGLAHFIGRGIETEVSYSLGKEWHLLAFEDAETARKRFQALGINYFLIQTTSPSFGALPASELFAPYEIVRNFKVIWADGDLYLLTWRTAGDTPADTATRQFAQIWASFGQQKVEFEDLYLRTRYIYWLNHGQAGDSIKAPRSLPEVHGWQ